MSTEVNAQPKSSNTATRGRRGGNRARGGAGNNTNRGRGGGASGGQRTNNKAVTAIQENAEAKTEDATISVTPPSNEEDGETAVCWICAEPVKYYCVSDCNHRTCHVCALRLRALYKKTDCTFCKDPQPSVMFTASEDTPFQDFDLTKIPFKDAKLSIYFETQDLMEQTLLLLRYNCPDDQCEYIGNGWGDLKLHVRAVHGKMMCDLCIRFKKVFAHEHALYPPNILPIHLPSMHHRHHKEPKEQIEGGIHPMCEFCRECFFSTDELYAHLRERHEECFICKRNEVRDQYFLNYEKLEEHFHTVHHPCPQPQCLAQKFVVFNSQLDLKAHTVDEHGGDMSSRDKKEARRLPAEFEFEEVAGGARRGRRDRERDRETNREPPPPQQQPRPPPPGAPPPNNVPARPPGPGRRREFGGALTGDGTQAGPASSVTPLQSRRASPSPRRTDVDPLVLERHAAFLSRVQSMSANPSSAIPAVKAAIRGYMASENSARDLILTVWTVLDEHLEHTASIINSFVDLLEEEDKKQDVLSYWNSFAIEQRNQFPDLIPTAVGSGYANIASGRVLNAKHVTATRSSRQSSGQVWDRVAKAASSSTPTSAPKAADRFPSLASSSSNQLGAGTSNTTPFRQGQRKTPWSASSTTSSTPTPTGFRPAIPASTSSNDPRIQSMPLRTGSGRQGASAAAAPPPKLSNSLFPELPSSSAAKQKPVVSGNVSLKNILGTTNTPSAWQGGGGSVNGDSNVAAAGDGTEASAGAAVSSKGKKGKGKQKQTLFTLGSFPT